MPENVMRVSLNEVLLSEAAVVRLICQGHAADGKRCGTAIEVRVDRLPFIFHQSGSGCPTCGTKFGRSEPGGDKDDNDPFKPLVKALETLKQVEGRVQLQFVLARPSA